MASHPGEGMENPFGLGHLFQPPSGPVQRQIIRWRMRATALTQDVLPGIDLNNQEQVKRYQAIMTEVEMLRVCAQQLAIECRLERCPACGGAGFIYTETDCGGCSGYPGIDHEPACGKEPCPFDCPVTPDEPSRLREENIKLAQIQAPVNDPEFDRLKEQFLAAVRHERDWYATHAPEVEFVSPYPGKEMPPAEVTGFRPDDEHVREVDPEG